jgi:hypothetical protein
VTVVGAILLVSARAMQAQSISRGGIGGSVRDSTGAGIPEALVTLTDEIAGARQTVAVASDGAFEFTLLAPGSYEVRAEQIGYRPVVVRDIHVEPSLRPVVTVTLKADSMPVTRIDTVSWSGPAFASEAGASYTLPRQLVQRFPTGRYDLASFGDFTTVAASDWGLEGLPGSATGVVIDGQPYDVAKSPWLPRRDPFGPALPLAAFAETAAELAPLDIDWGDYAGGVASATTRRGTSQLTTQIFGDWAPISSSGLFDKGSLTPQTFLGGLVVAGPVRRDTANFVIGGQAEQLDLLRPAAWPAADSALADAAGAAGQSLTAYLTPRLVRETRASGFGRFNWLIAPGQMLDAWVSGGHYSRDDPDVGPLAAPGLGARAEGTDLTAGAVITSRLTGRLSQELRAGFVNSQRKYTAAPLPATYFADGQAAGTDPTLPGSFDLTSVRLRDDILVDLGTHQLKLGIGGVINNYNDSYTFGSGGSFYFTDATGLGAMRGAYYGVAGTEPGAQFTVPELAVLLQDRWEVAPGFAFLVGARYDAEFLPRSSILPNQAWLNATGLSNDSIRSMIGKWSSRLGFDWRAGQHEDWHLRGGIGLYYSRVDPAVLAELIGQAGQNDVHRGVGALGAWPTAPEVAAAPDVGARLTLLGPDFQPPRSGKASLGIGRRLGRSGIIELALDVRHTDFLPRRHDLNRPLGVSGHDQYGRPIYGTLVKEGSILALDPSSPRRFGGFELVSAIDPDGYSDYAGVTLRLVEPLGRFVRLYGSYTYSHTSDNWLSGLNAGPYAQLSPFPDSLGGQDWADGTSGFDIPHRVSLGVELRPAGSDAVTLAVRYRWQSGEPFTPGVGTGVDANGDGSFTNDPAFVDDTLPGMSELFAAWPCLRPMVGQFAKRNSCRDPDVGTVDLRLGIAPVRRYPVELWVEGFNLNDPAQGVWDHALYNVDPAAVLGVDNTTRRVTIPYVVNPHFGKQLRLLSPGRVVRVGLRVNY